MNELWNNLKKHFKMSDITTKVFYDFFKEHENKLTEEFLKSLRNGKHFKISGVPMVCYYLKDHKEELKKWENKKELKKMGKKELKNIDIIAEKEKEILILKILNDLDYWLEQSDKEKQTNEYILRDLKSRWVKELVNLNLNKVK